MASGAAKRYAQAVFELAKEAERIDRWQADLEVLTGVMADPTVARFLTSPSVEEGAKIKLLDQALAAAQPEVRNLARLLVHRQRLDIIPELYRLFAERVLAERGIAVADVTTAEAIGPREQELVRAQLSRLVGKDVQLRLHTDPTIIGGVVARVGDMLIDGSVVNQLRRLRARLAAPA